MPQTTAQGGAQVYHVERMTQPSFKEVNQFNANNVFLYPSNVDEVGKLKRIYLESLHTNVKEILKKRKITESEMPSLFNFDMRSFGFVGRKKYLEKIESALMRGVEDQRWLAICGLGGIGKSHLVKEYAFRHRSFYNFIWLINASSRTSLDEGYTALLSAINHVDSLNQKKIEISNLGVEEIRRQCFDSLKHFRNWLIIFDDVVEEEEFLRHLPPQYLPTNHILVTSRNINLEKIPVKTMGILKKKESVKLMQSIILGEVDDKKSVLIKDREEDLKKLVDLLGNLPLAMVQAANYIRRTKITISQYILEFLENRSKLWEKEKKPIGYTTPLQSTWSLSLEKINDFSSLGKKFLDYCAYLEVNDIPRWLFRELLGISDLDLDEIISNLLSFSMISYDESNNSFSIHTLVQKVIEDGLSEEEKILCIKKLINLFNELFLITNNRSKEEVAINRVLYHHVRNTVLACEKNKIINEALLSLLVKLGDYNLKELSNTDCSLTFLNQAKTLSQDILLLKQRFESQILHSLGNAYFNDENYQTAEKMYQESLALLDKETNKGLLQNRAIGLHQLANTYSRRNKLEEALGHYLNALSINKEIHKDKPNPYTANNLHEIANIYSLQGDHSQALSLIEDAVQIKTKYYTTSKNPDVAITIDMWGILLCRANKFNEAKRKLHEALKIYEKTYGYEHTEYKEVKSRLLTLMRATEESASDIALIENSSSEQDKPFKLRIEDISRDFMTARRVKLLEESHMQSGQIVVAPAPTLLFHIGTVSTVWTASIRAGSNLSFSSNLFSRSYGHQQRNIEDFLNAAESGNFDKVMEMLQSKAVDVDCFLEDFYGNTALLRACYYGNFKIVEYLIKHGANVHYRNISGSSALTLAVKSPENIFEKKKIVEFLLKMNLNLLVRDRWNKTVFDWAKEENDKDILEMLNRSHSQNKSEMERSPLGPQPILFSKKEDLPLPSQEEIQLNYAYAVSLNSQPSLVSQGKGEKYLCTEEINVDDEESVSLGDERNMEEENDKRNSSSTNLLNRCI